MKPENQVKIKKDSLETTFSLQKGLFFFFFFLSSPHLLLQTSFSKLANIITLLENLVKARKISTNVMCPDFKSLTRRFFFFRLRKLFPDFSLKARFHYERGKKHSLFVLLLFFCARFNFNRSLQSKINKRNKECSFPRS